MGYKNLCDQARSGKTKTMDSEAVIQAIEANPACNTWFGLVSLFNGILIFMGYSMPKPSK